MEVIRIAYARMKAKSQVSVRLDPLHLKLLEDLQPLYGNSKSEVARLLIVDGMEEKFGLERLREKKAIR